MSSKMEETLGLPKREILGSLVQLHSKMDAISASTKLWTKSASSSFDRKKILSSNNGSAAVVKNFPYFFVYLAIFNFPDFQHFLTDKKWHEI